MRQSLLLINYPLLFCLLSQGSLSVGLISCFPKWRNIKHFWLHREGGRGGSYVVLVELLCSYFLVREGGRGATQCWWSYFVATSQLAVCVSRVECCRAVLLLVASWRWVSSISDISGISIISTHLWDIKLQYIDHHTCSSISIGYSSIEQSLVLVTLDHSDEEIWPGWPNTTTMTKSMTRQYRKYPQRVALKTCDPCENYDFSDNFQLTSIATIVVTLP